jgi:NAD(P)-dependent dehydrogenase (short-subunit alcohol dehydrogenase family)
MANEDRVALVTGAGSGIGRAVTLALNDAGFHVVLAGRRIPQLAETASMKRRNDRRLITVSTDVSKPDSVGALFRRATEEFGRLDVLFNNAGTSAPPVLFEDLTWDQWTSVVGVNLNGMFLCAQEAFRMMKEQTPQGGRIINNGSISAYAPRPNSAPYTATKHAVTGLTKSLSLDGRKYDIACGQIDVGNAATDMTKRTAEGVPQANGTVAPEPRLDVNAVAEAVLYMAKLPLEGNVQFMTVMATKMPFVGRG